MATSFRHKSCLRGVWQLGADRCYRYRAKLDAENAVVADWLVRLTNNQRNWGFGLCFLYLRNVKGFKWNHKRV